MSITTGLAIYGAIVSTAAFVWHLYRDLTDRGHVRVRCYIGKIVGGVGPPDRKDYLVYSITNVGRKPVMVTHLGGEYRGSRSFIVVPRSLPKMLQPGDYVLEYTPEFDKLSPDVRRLCVWDSHGRRYSAPRKELRAVLRSVAKGQ